MLSHFVVTPKTRPCPTVHALVKGSKLFLPRDACNAKRGNAIVSCSSECTTVKLMYPVVQVGLFRKMITVH